MSKKKSAKSGKRKVIKNIFKAVALCLLAAFLFSALACGVKNIKVTGNDHETDDEVISLLGNNPFSRNAVFLYLFNRNRTVSGNTFIDTVTVNLDSRNDITVNVREKKLIGYVEYDDRYWYFNRSGLILVSTDKKEENITENAGMEAAPSELHVDDSYELSENRLQHISAIRTCLLSADGVIYGDEFADETVNVFDESTEETEAGAAEETADEADVYEEYTGDGEGYEEYTEETGEYTEETETADEYTTDAESGDGVYTEDEPEEYVEEYTGDAESDDGEYVEAEVPETETIASADISEDTAVQNSALPEQNTAETWELDTSAKGGNYLPLVEGLVFSEAVLGYPLPVQFDRVFSSVAVVKSFVDRSGYVPDRVYYEKNGDLVITYGNASINLGNGENIEQRVSVVGEALPSFAGLSGVLHLENYDGTQKRLIFSKN